MIDIKAVFAEVARVGHWQGDSADPDRDRKAIRMAARKAGVGIRTYTGPWADRTVVAVEQTGPLTPEQEAASAVGRREAMKALADALFPQRPPR
jgi:hypothetical protein